MTAPEVHGFLGGRVAVIHHPDGHRAGLDAALLQATVPAAARGLLVDLGSGNGAVALSALARAPRLHALLVECDSRALGDLAKALELPQNNHVAPRCRIVDHRIGDAGAPHPDLAPGTVDWVVMNPPFREAGQAGASPDRRRASAHLAQPGDLEAWIGLAQRLLRSGGRLALVDRPERLPALLSQLPAGFGGLVVLPIQPHADSAAKRILLVARKGAEAPFTLRPALVLHAGDGSWTRPADAILKGDADLSHALW